MSCTPRFVFSPPKPQAEVTSLEGEKTSIAQLATRFLVRALKCGHVHPFAGSFSKVVAWTEVRSEGRRGGGDSSL